MYTAIDDESSGARRKRAAAAVLFVGLLLLSVSWPLPVVVLNGVTFDAELPLHDKSFLGREAPSWDVVFWAIAGLYALALIDVRTGGSPSVSAFRKELAAAGHQCRAALRVDGSLRVLAFAVAAIATTAFVWIVLDGWVLIQAEVLRTGWPRQLARYVNRLGGGMNPALIVGFFALTGVILPRRRWRLYAIAMAAGGLASGLAVQVVKLTISRARPELWFGPFFFTESTSSSFPSGHTAGAFALAGVLLFGSPSITVRCAAFAIAGGVAVSRVIVFRHWPSDVVAGAMIGLMFAWFFTRAVVREGNRERVEASSPLPAGEGKG